MRNEERDRLEVGRSWIYVDIDCEKRCIVQISIVVNKQEEDEIREMEIIKIDKKKIDREEN